MKSCETCAWDGTLSCAINAHKTYYYYEHNLICSIYKPKENIMKCEICGEDKPRMAVVYCYAWPCHCERCDECGEKYCADCDRDSYSRCPFVHINDKPDYVEGAAFYPSMPHYSIFSTGNVPWCSVEGWNIIHNGYQYVKEHNDGKTIILLDWQQIPANIRREFIAAYHKRIKEKKTMKKCGCPMIHTSLACQYEKADLCTYQDEKKQKRIAELKAKIQSRLDNIRTITMVGEVTIGDFTTMAGCAGEARAALSELKGLEDEH